MACAWSQTEEDNVVQGLDCGADDYITKPFKRSEFLARVRCQLGDLDLTDELEGERAAGCVCVGVLAG